MLLHAPKNGFFYVLDRATGELLSAKPYAAVSWASAIDLKTGRPIVNAAAIYENQKSGSPLVPGPDGAHTWHSMSFNPLTGLAYIPVSDSGFLYKSGQQPRQSDLAFNVGIDFVAAGMPQKPEIKKARDTFPPGTPCNKKKSGAWNARPQRTADSSRPLAI